MKIVLISLLALAVISISAFIYLTDELGSPVPINPNVLNDSLKKAKQHEVKFNFPMIRYTLDTVKDVAHLRRIVSKYKWRDSAKTNHKIFTLLNRKELRFIRVGSQVIIPDTIIPNTLAYSVFPSFYDSAVGIPKLIMVSNRLMSYGCYEYGKLVRFAACNPGKERTPSYPGRYALNWKERTHLSSLDSTWEMPFTWNFHLEAGSAFHQFVMPGYPASHSCIRQFSDDAEWLYYWGRGIKRDSVNRFIPMSGTPVIIVDHYDFNKGQGRQWTKLASNRDGILTLPHKPMEVEEALIPMSQIPLVSRGRLRNKSRFIYAEDTLRSRGIIREGVSLTVTRDFNKARRHKAAKAHSKPKQN